MVVSLDLRGVEAMCLGVGNRFFIEHSCDRVCRSEKWRGEKPRSDLKKGIKESALFGLQRRMVGGIGALTDGDGGFKDVQ